MEAPTLNEWKEQGRFEEVLGHRVFVIESGDSKETLVILHGFPSCSYDYYRVLPLLSPHFRIIVHDHPGFGLSEKNLNYSYSFFEQADVAIALWQKLGLKEVHLLAHDYGTSIGTELIARANRGFLPVQFKSVTLGNGSMLIDMAKLQVTQVLLKSHFWGPIVTKIINRGFFHYSFRKLWADKSKINPKEFDVLWDMIQHDPDGLKVFPRVSRYIIERKQFWHRWIGALEQYDQPINLLWADKDPVAIIDMAHVLSQKIRQSNLKILENIGHYPMLEAPEAYANGLKELLKLS